MGQSVLTVVFHNTVTCGCNTVCSACKCFLIERKPIYPITAISLYRKRIDLSAYRYVFKHPATILNAYKVTAIFSIATMVLSTVMTSLFAYPLSRKIFKARNKLSLLMYFTTMFSGGLVPHTY